MSNEVNSIDELVVNGESQLKSLAQAGDSIAREWLMKIGAVSSPMIKLSFFGEMRVALTQDTRPEARAVYAQMFGEEP